MIVDPHQHLWDLSQNKHSWLISEVEDSFLGNYEPLRKSYQLSDYLQDAQRVGIAKSVHIQAGWNSADPVGETAWLQSTADRYGFPHSIVAFADFTSPNAEDVLAKHCQFPNVRGIRQILNWHDNSYLSGCGKDYINIPIWQKNFGLLAKYNLSFDAQIYPSQAPVMAVLAKRYSYTQIILDHALMPLFQHNVTDFNAWQKSLQQLAQLPNVAIKISGFGMFDHNWTVETIKPLVLKVIETFGVDRCMFASNFPVDKLYGSLTNIYQAFASITGKFSEVEKHKLFYSNAERIYRLR